MGAKNAAKRIQRPAPHMPRAGYYTLTPRRASTGPARKNRGGCVRFAGRFLTQATNATDRCQYPIEQTRQTKRHPGAVVGRL
jgi:hypothetical protein